MKTEDVNALPGTGTSRCRCISENEEPCESDLGLSEVGSQPSKNDAEEETVDEKLAIEGDAGTLGTTMHQENLQLSKGDIGIEGTSASEDLGLCVSGTGVEQSANQNSSVLDECDVGTEDGELTVEAEVDMDLVDSPVRQVNIEVAECVTVEESLNSFSFRVNAENGCLDSQNESVISDEQLNGHHLSGAKRARWTFDEEQASVHIKYNSITRASKRKLEELLQKWSEWHSQHGSSTQDVNEVLESGEETYFPALRVGLDKPSAVSFWIEDKMRNQQNDGNIPLDGSSVPLYDRGYALGLTSPDGPSNVEGGLEILNDAARCFNCGSYNHSLKECPKPRDNAAVNSARKQLKSKRNLNSGSRNPTRYYQNSSGGKYDGLKPGTLHAETRQLLGLGELDPPPWLNRMRELGYPPGYFDPDDDDQSSGIIIFADEDAKDEQEDGEIVETGNSEPRRKRTVEFPGINAPAPENADERLWEVGSSSFDPFINQSHRRLNHSSEPTSGWHHHEQRRSRGLVDDGPPGVDLVLSPSPSSYPPRYGNYDPSYSSESSKGLTPTFARSHSERRRRSSLAYEDYSRGSPPYHSADRRSSPQDIGAVKFAYETDNRRDNLENHFRSNDTYDRRRHRNR